MRGRQVLFVVSAVTFCGSLSAGTAMVMTALDGKAGVIESVAEHPAEHLPAGTQTETAANRLAIESPSPVTPASTSPPTPLATATATATGTARTATPWTSPARSTIPPTNTPTAKPLLPTTQRPTPTWTRVPAPTAYDDLEAVALVKVLESDSAIIQRRFGQWLVEYGVGCLSLYRYEGRTIYLTKGRIGYIGVGAKLILPNGDSCRIWDSEEL